MMLDSQAIARQANPGPDRAECKMKRKILAAACLLIGPTIISAQTSSSDSRRNDSGTVRDRVIGPKTPNPVQNSKPASDQNLRPVNTASQTQSTGSWGNTNLGSRPAPTATPTQVAGTNAIKKTGQSDIEASKKLVKQTTLRPEVPAAENGRAVTSRTRVPTTVYNVGVGDVLDIRVLSLRTRESTLFTVLRNGTIEYPLLSGPITVVGLTTEDIGRLMSREIRVIKGAQVSVSVRDYASHGVIVSGLVENAGRRILRREAVPLYTVLAESLVRPEATVATIMRAGKEGTPLSLKDEQSMATLVVPGDVIKISGSQMSARFLYVGGDVAAPGEKTFREGMTLTQALLSAGGVPSGKKNVKIARRNSGGYLSTNEYNLRSIEDGKSPDPLVEAGDRIEVIRNAN
jgi:protein involved in polysaccharide export with SLBB domain